MKIIYIVVSIIFFSSAAHSTIKEREVMSYLDISKELDIYFQQTKVKYNRLVLSLHLEKNMVNPLITKTFQEFVANPKYIKIYFDIFSSLAPNLYNDMMSFYKTKVGQKYAKEINISHILSEDEIRKRYKQLVNSGILTEDKLQLIRAIINSFNVANLEFEYAKNLLHSVEDSLDEDKKIDLEELKILLKEYTPIIFGVYYQNFTLDELEEVLKYASSVAGKTEMIYSYEVESKIEQQFYIDVNSSLNTLIDMRIYQEYTIGVR